MLEVGEEYRWLDQKIFLKSEQLPKYQVPKYQSEEYRWFNEKIFSADFLHFTFWEFLYQRERENMLGHHFADTAAVKILRCSVYKVLPHGAASEAVLKMLPHGASEAVKWFLKACWRRNSGGGDATQLGSILFFKNVHGKNVDKLW